MAPHARWLLLPLALGLGLTATSAAEHRPAVSAYHQEIRTAVRSDAPPAAREHAWADGPAGQWWNDGDTSRSRWWTGHRPDPNRRPFDDPTEKPQGTWSHDATGWDGWRGPDERARRGWRAGWRGAAPGWGGVWWYGWGGDWPAYAGRWERGQWDASGRGWHHPEWGGHRGGFHGEFGFERGWGGGGRVIALPAPRE